MDMTKTALSALRKALDEKKVSARELCEECFKAIDKDEEKIGAFISLTKEEALKNAKAAQKRIDEGKAAFLTGIPLAIKDNICTDGIKTTCASNMLNNFVPPYDANVIEKLKAQDYVIIGKTNMDEFAMGGATQTSYFKRTHNPKNTDCVPGGSSGGSAAAVSAGFAPAALGSDTGGSIRQPASFCGVTGLKPTYGRVSRYGLVAFGSSLDQIGPIANTAADCGEILNVIAGHDERDATSSKLSEENFNKNIGKSVSGLRLALPKEFYGEAVDEEVKTAVTNAAKELEKQGAVLVDCEMPSLKYGIPAYYLIACAEAASNLSRFDGIKYGLRGEGKNYQEMILDSRNRGFGIEVKRRILLGNYALSSGYFDAYYRKACALRQKIIAEYSAIFEKADAVLTPTAPSVAYKIGSQDNDPVKMYTADILTVPVNIAGLPAISTTCGYNGDNMPIGMSVVGKRFDEATVLQIADAFERGFNPVYSD
ncbi:MAG: Asp-tRNA(Asn)/Glu-tRNA(Gln) amidotransferase subunit GatA [[Eubacterium] siraeum]|nr:Asp-tRNA(Asn)/Glu-tRNA(Gln) amidotransferase subunit GatA [[Eubacterium] siraeum]